jgi:hypothetical protein
VAGKLLPGARELITIDGVRAEYADGFGLARASNTTPVVVLRFEADTQAALNASRPNSAPRSRGLARHRHRFLKPRAVPRRRNAVTGIWNPDPTASLRPRP